MHLLRTETMLKNKTALIMLCSVYYLQDLSECGLLEYSVFGAIITCVLQLVVSS